MTKLRLKNLFVKAVNDEMGILKTNMNYSDSQGNYSLKKVKTNISNKSPSMSQIQNFQSSKNEKLKSYPNFSNIFNEEMLDYKIESNFCKIKQMVEYCCNVQEITKNRISQTHCTDMKQLYDSFISKNSGFLITIFNSYCPASRGNPLKAFLMKFLLDIQIEHDIQKLNTMEILFLEKFIIDRYFKILKNKILMTVVSENLVGKFLVRFDGQKNKGNLNYDQFKFDIKTVNKKYCEFVSSLSINMAYSDKSAIPIFDKRFMQLFVQEEFTSADLDELFEFLCLIINRTVSILIVKFISKRFHQVKQVFDNIERLEQSIFFILKNLFNILICWRQKSIAMQNQTNMLNFVSNHFKRLEEIFCCDSKLNLFFITKYVKYREMREYIGRKKKSDFIKPRRNDEKMKKIYKRIMKHMIEDFKKNAQSTPLEEMEEIKHKNIHSEQLKIKDGYKMIFENSKMFISDSEDEANLFVTKYASFIMGEAHVAQSIDQSDAGLDEKFQKKIKTLRNPNDRFSKLTSREKEEKFYEFYFKKEAKALGIPVSFFYDPLKQKHKNPQYKSFTIKYFKLLMKSQTFATQVKNYLENDRIMIEVLTDYPKQLNDLFVVCQTILLDQHKNKAKFLWTCYEFYFALFFFKSKFNL